MVLWKKKKSFYYSPKKVAFVFLHMFDNLAEIDSSFQPISLIFILIIWSVKSDF